MEWLKINSRMSQDLQVRRLSDRAFRDWIRLLELCGYHETDGHFTDEDAQLEGIAKPSLQALFAGGLISPNGDGYTITNWLKYQQSKADMAERREQARLDAETRSQSARHAANARWHTPSNARRNA